MDKVERVARAICQARGQNPDADSGRGPMVTVTRQSSSHSTHYSQEQQAVPNWRTFETEAKVFIAAQEALADET
ncbi:MAG: hypothetical protein JWP35_1897 [Caulobacter sp.]|nr:hypothetical protein [Caulobacter sp.]